MARFDEVELEAVMLDAPAPPATTSRLRRFFALLTDLSLFAALTFALLPLLPTSRNTLATIALSGFIVVVSYYYFVGSWLLWRKTIGGTIFDIRVVANEGDSLPLMSATMRWAGLWVSVLTLGIGFLFAVPNRLSGTRSV